MRPDPYGLEARATVVVDASALVVREGVAQAAFGEGDREALPSLLALSSELEELGAVFGYQAPENSLRCPLQLDFALTRFRLRTAAPVDADRLPVDALFLIEIQSSLAFLVSHVLVDACMLWNVSWLPVFLCKWVVAKRNRLDFERT
jgi:hypothetical protein